MAYSSGDRPRGSHQFQGFPETTSFTSCFSEFLFWRECFSLGDSYKAEKCNFHSKIYVIEYVLSPEK